MMLPKQDFNTYLRWVQTGDIDRVLFIRNITFDALKKLGVSRDLSKAVTGGIRAGSDQFDGGTFTAWVNSIQPEQKRAVWQLQALDATAVKRSE